ncbi:hypothetical protein BC940DRAFT_366742 [Gongronella butleri]|nr:hypothetical protein BC940DRAFT_366742 [Gongronella butleri]
MFGDHYARLARPMYFNTSPYYPNMQNNPYYPQSAGMMAYPNYPSTPFNGAPYTYPATMPPMANSYMDYSARGHQPYYPGAMGGMGGHFPREPSCFDGCCSSNYDYYDHMAYPGPQPAFPNATVGVSGPTRKQEPSQESE